MFLRQIRLVTVADDDDDDDNHVSAVCYRAWGIPSMTVFSFFLSFVLIFNPAPASSSALLKNPSDSLFTGFVCDFHFFDGA